MKKLVLMLSVICLMTACGNDEAKCETPCVDSTSVCCDSTKSTSCVKDSVKVTPADTTKPRN